MRRLKISDQRPVVVVGAGVAGLAAAFDLATRGVPVVVLEAGDRPGGKMRRTPVGSTDFDAGPTVLTMRWVFDEMFGEAGLSFADHVTTRPASVLARHSWGNTATLDLHADAARSADAIAQFAGPDEGRRFLGFCQEARATYQALEHAFIRAQRPSMPGLVGRIGSRRAADLLAIRPFENLWHALGRHFRDPRLRQLFGRYATYCGSSPFTAPATLMLVAHVEQEGVWLAEPGMYGIAEALEKVARSRGAHFRYDCAVRRLGRDAQGEWRIELASGEVVEAGAVIANADAAAMARGLLGAEPARAAAGSDRLARSLSAITWLVSAPTQGFDLLRHNVFFSTDYAAEFEAIFGRRELPDDPTIYVCAQDRGAAGATAAAGGTERLLCLINAPADGDKPGAGGSAALRNAHPDRIYSLLARFGLHIDRDRAVVRQSRPEDFERQYPGTGGALYGSATHGWRASFQRPGAASAVPGLFLAGGSVHPGPGVPMAALSGRLAARCVLAAA
jgi:1-hydroxycarotenoid 3,4-desaturase